MNVAGKEIAFSYGHRLLEYEHQCRFLHGHNGKAVLVLRTDGLSSTEVERMQHDVAAWIDANLDHAMLLNRRDDAVASAGEKGCDLGTDTAGGACDEGDGLAHGVDVART